ncbi:VWA domain-containing protein [Candidatus Leptofilum sp.]|uniref:VWA domain-containing protein n=1 Tax=Candidatus Leptofilum sp. TaxID=3241576 RepID=UPI003B58B67C
MKLKNFRGFPLLFILLALPMMACGLFGLSGDGIPSNAVVVNVMANTTAAPWLETAVTTFNDSEAETSSGDPVFVIVNAVESGEAIAALQADPSIALWLPEEAVWTDVLADDGDNSFQNDCESVAQSPLVIGMWREVAEALGWPGLPLGWLDIGSLAADPAAWNYYSGGTLGQSFKLGHTHPGLSGSGASTLLAIVQAAESKTDAVSVGDIGQPIVQASVGAFEGGVTWFSSSTQSLATTMAERGVDYLTAGIMYEANVAQLGGDNIVAIYPLEGTFIAEFPACVRDSVTAAEREAAALFRDYLLSAEGQQLAADNGLRPVDSAISLPATEAIDPSQPALIFDAPSTASIFAVQELWQEARKDVNLVMLLDTSGSMRGSKIRNMQEAAVQFVSQMGDDDYISLIAFSTEPELIVRHVLVGENRDKIINAINDLSAVGDTTLFDAIGDGSALLTETSLPSTANAMVVLTDGQDTRSYRFNSATAMQEALANDATVFTIAYGGDADENTLERLAIQANGNFFVGDEASIAAIYEEMSAAFGGSVGVGR